MESRALLSVVIPVYNAMDYLDDCMNSVFNQTYGNLEIILINDGSTDDSDKVCRKYAADPRVTYISRENKGLSATRQEGIELAHGKYVCTLDSDDMWDKTFAEQMLEKIRQHDADVCVCGRIDFDGTNSNTILLRADKAYYELTQESVSGNLSSLAADLWLADAWNKIYKTDFLRESGVKYTLNNRYNGTDLLFNYLLCLHTPKYCICNEPLLMHRIVQGSRVHRKNKPLQEGFEIIAERIVSEAKMLHYPDLFYEKIGLIHFRWLKMILQQIILESESVQELVERYNVFFRRNLEYETNCGYRLLGSFEEEKNLFSYNGFINLCVRKRLSLLLVIYWLQKTAKEKIRSGKCK